MPPTVQSTIPRHGRSLLILACPLLFAIAGCSAEDPRAAELREHLLLDEEPQPSMTIEEVHLTSADKEMVVLLGKVGVPKLARWHEPDKAVFAISEGTPGSDYNVGPDHDPSTCPFCKSRWKDEHSFTYVTLTDRSGDVVPINALTLLKLSEGDIISVRGQPTISESGLLELRCDGVFIHR